MSFNIMALCMAFISDPIVIALFVLSVLVLILLIVVCCIGKKVKRINRNAKNGNLAQTIELYYDKVNGLMDQVDNVSNRFEIYEKQNAASLRRTGIVHFNAFHNISGNMSFALAIVNDKGDGMILTSLFGHEGSNIYLREVKDGKPSIAVSEEEQQALSIALRQ